MLISPKLPHFPGSREPVLKTDRGQLTKYQMFKPTILQFEFIWFMNNPLTIRQQFPFVILEKMPGTYYFCKQSV